MFEALKKTIGVCLMGLGLRNIISIVTSCYRMAISNRSSGSYSWNHMAIFEKIGFNMNTGIKDCKSSSLFLYKIV